MYTFFSYLKVFFAIDIHTKKEYAIKICEKRHIKKVNKIEAVVREKTIMDILNKCQCSLFIKLAYTFQDSARLCKF